MHKPCNSSSFPYVRSPRFRALTSNKYLPFMVIRHLNNDMVCIEVKGRMYARRLGSDV